MSCWSWGDADDRRDYSQAVDVGTLGRGIKLGTIRVLVWVMAFMAHGYATEEFEVIPPSLSLSFSAVTLGTTISLRKGSDDV